MEGVSEPVSGSVSVMLLVSVGSCVSDNERVSNESVFDSVFDREWERDAEVDNESVSDCVFVREWEREPDADGELVSVLESVTESVGESVFESVSLSDSEGVYEPVTENVLLAVIDSVPPVKVDVFVSVASRDSENVFEGDGVGGGVIVLDSELLVVDDSVEVFPVNVGSSDNVFVFADRETDSVLEGDGD